MRGPVFVEIAPSHTKGRDVFLMVSTEFLGPGDRVLVVDEFLATGATIMALVRLVQHAEAELVGIGTVIEKAFEGDARTWKLSACLLSRSPSSSTWATGR
jgi:xanthine phosphoribosyltransferase